MGFFSEKILFDVVTGEGPAADGKQVWLIQEKGRLFTMKDAWVNYGKFTIEAVDWNLQQASNLSGAAAGAAVGAVLTGGVGALVGAAIGGKNKDVSTAVITYKDQEEKSYRLIVKCNADKYKQLSKLLK